MARDARRDPSQPDEDELLPAALRRRPTLPFGMAAVRGPAKPSESSARPRPATLRPRTPTPSGVVDDVHFRRDTPVAKRLGGFAPDPEDERFLAELASELRPQLAWLLGDRRHEFHRELAEGRLDLALEMLLADRKANPRNISASKAASTLRSAIQEHIRERVGPIDAVPFLLKDPPTVSRSHVRVLPLVNGVSTIEDIVGSCQLPILETIRTLSRLHNTGCIQVPGARSPIQLPRPAAALAPKASSSPGGHRPRPHDEETVAASSRLTMPEILVPFAADLEALGVGNRADLGDGSRIARSGIHSALGVTERDDAAAPDEDLPPVLAVPTAPDAGHDVSHDVSHEVSHDVSLDVSHDVSLDVSHEVTALEEQAPSADLALDELGAIWRERARRKSDVDEPAPPTVPPSALTPAERESSPSRFPSIPALDPPQIDAIEIPAAAPPSSRRSPPGRRIPFAARVAVAAVVVIGAMFIFRAATSSKVTVGSSDVAAPPRGAPTSALSAPVPLVAATALDVAAPAPPQPETFIDRGTVTFTVRVTPSYARVFIDDVLLVPVSEVKLRREDRTHLLRAEAPGFVTRSLTVSSKSDASLVLALDRAPAGPIPSAAAPTGKPAE